MTAKRGDGRRVDYWLYDGSTEYEGSLVKLGDSGFTAHVREATSPGSTGRRLPLQHFELQLRFLDRRFLAYFKDCADTRMEVIIDAVQRSSMEGFDYFLCGRFARTASGLERPAGEPLVHFTEEPETTQIWL